MVKQVTSPHRDFKQLLDNFFSLSALQVAEYLLPLITLPYLIRVIGPENFGLIVFAQAFLQYFVILTDYGFNLSATREIARNRDNPARISEIYSSVFTIKLLTMLLSVLILSFIVLGVDKFRMNWEVYFLTFGTVAGSVLFPPWYFQGIEKMRYISILSISARLFFFISIFFFIKNSSDYLYVPLLNSLGMLISGILAMIIIRKNFGVVYRIPSYSSIIYHLKAGKHMFISTLSINIYKVTNDFVLGLFTTNSIVGYFSIAKKLVDAANQFAVIVSQTIYPRISCRIRASYRETVAFLKKTGLMIFAVTLTISLLFLLFSKSIISVIAGEAYREAFRSLQIMSFVPLIIGVNVPAVQLLLCSGSDKEFSMVVTIGAILNLLLNFTLIPLISYTGACLAVIISEFIVTGGLYAMVFYKYRRTTLPED